jgi:pyruvate dehydrogenase E2 component (dihydrolipoamide acetyltransferase)
MNPRSEEIRVPDIGDFDEVDVIEVLVAPGDHVAVDDGLITLESDKASMDVPSPEAGTVREVRVEAGGKVSQGDVILTLEPDAAPAEEPEKRPTSASAGGPEPGGASPPRSRRQQPVDEDEAEAQARAEAEAIEPAEAASAGGHEARLAARQRRRERAAGPRPTIPLLDEEVELRPLDEDVDEDAFGKVYASPAVRHYARELGVDLARVEGSGRKGRIVRYDVRTYVQRKLGEVQGAGGAGLGGGLALPELPEIDFSKWGEVERRELSKIQRLTGKNVHRAWITIPHVTQHDQADVTELEAFRKAQSEEAERREVRLSPIPFLIRAVVAALREYPRFNASLAADGDSLILKKYFHVGVAVDTDSGLVVPVVRDAESKGLFQLAAEVADLAERARSRKLKSEELEGGSFTISSLGGIGGTTFTPIVNWPEVAILGVSRMEWQPVWQDGDFVPRLMMPLSLSYDHRVIDGAAAVRFTRYLATVLGDIRRLLL